MLTLKSTHLQYLHTCNMTARFSSSACLMICELLWFFRNKKKCDMATALCLLCNFEHELTLFTNFTVVCIIISWQKADFEIKMAIEFSANFPTLQKMIYIFSHTYCDFSTNPDLISAKFLAKTAHLY